MLRALKDHLDNQVLLDLQVHLVKLELLVRVAPLVHREFQEMLEDLERPVKKALLVHQDPKERQEYQEHRGYRDFLEKEVFLDCLECLA